MKFLSSRFPTIYGVYNQFKTGSVQLYRDGKLTYTLKPTKGQIYKPQEIITHYEFPADLKRCLPAFVIFWIPFVGFWLSLPLAVIFPDKVLSRQFWTDKQRVTSLDKALAKRRKLYPNLTNSLLQALDNKEIDPKISQISCDIIQQVTSGEPLELDHSTLLRKAFASKPMQKLNSDHSMELRICIGSSKLKKHALYLNNVDQSLARYQPELQTSQILDMIIHQRGFHLGEASIEDKLQFIHKWLSLTDDIKAQELGYLLHLPLLMTDNQKLYTQQKKAGNLEGNSAS